MSGGIGMVGIVGLHYPFVLDVGSFSAVVFLLVKKLYYVFLGMPISIQKRLAKTADTVFSHTCFEI